MQHMDVEDRIRHIMTVKWLQETLPTPGVADWIYQQYPLEAHHEANPDNQVVLIVFDDITQLKRLVADAVGNCVAGDSVIDSVVDDNRVDPKRPLPPGECYPGSRLLPVTNAEFIASAPTRGPKKQSVLALEDDTRHTIIWGIAIPHEDGPLLGRYFPLNATITCPRPRHCYSEMARRMLQKVLHSSQVWWWGFILHMYTPTPAPQVMSTPDSSTVPPELNDVPWRLLTVAWPDRAAMAAAFRAYRLTGEWTKPDPYVSAGGEDDKSEGGRPEEPFEVRLCLGNPGDHR